MQAARSQKRGTAGLLIAGLSLAVAAAVPSARADEAQAKSLVKAMSDYMAAQKVFSYDYDTTLEVVTKEKQKLALASSGTLVASRPDKIRYTRWGGFANAEAVFDGKTLSLLGKNMNAYTQVEIPGTIDHLVDTLRDKYGRPVPGADLLLSNIYDQLMPEVTNVKDLGTGVIGGIECNHLAFRTAEVDWQIWIATGDQPHPCRYTITSTKVAGFPEYRLDLRNWKTGSEVKAVDFAFTAPPDAKKLDLADLGNTDELPDHFKLMKGAAR